MSPDKSLPAEPSQAKPYAEPEADAIPTLDEALDLPMEVGEHDSALAGADDYASTASYAEEAQAVTDPAMDQPSLSLTQNLELNVDLGYAAEQEEYVENDDLAEMDEIQTLPLAEMVLDDSQDTLVSAEHKRQIATLEAIVFEGENPNALAPKTRHLQEDEPVSAPQNPDPPQADPAKHAPEQPQAQTPSFTPAPGKPLPTKSENPFLPQHILDRLNQGKRNLVEEIAQSSAALDASTAILRTHARAERLAKPAYSDAKPQQYSFSRDKSAQQKQKMVDDLVEEYLPLLAAELRRRLRKILDE